MNLEVADGDDSRGPCLAFDETAMIGQAAWRHDFIGDDEASAESVQTVERDGIYAEIPLEPGVPYVTIETLDNNGQVLATGTPQA